MERENNGRGTLGILRTMRCVERNFEKIRDVEGEAWYVALTAFKQK